MNTKLEENNYIKVEEFLHPELAQQLGLQFRKDCVERYVKSDNNVEHAPAVHMYPAFAQLLFAKVFFMNDIIGEKLYPTYAYSRWYQTGAELKPHVDKQACEISVSVNLYGDEWPIYMTTPAGEIAEVILKPGDAVIYRGMRSRHWREKFKGKECIQVFLHYVKIEGPNVLHAFNLHGTELS
jgi:hypothetical protein